MTALLDPPTRPRPRPVAATSAPRPAEPAVVDTVVGSAAGSVANSVVGGPRRRVSDAPSVHPPNAPVTAPPDGQLFWYLGSQQRWIAVVTSIAFALAGVSLFEFSLRAPVLYPFLAVLAVNVIGSLLALLSGLNDRRVTKQSHLSLVRSWRPISWPSVDVFLPCCGEDLVVLENTYRHVAELQWDGALRVLVLDDADRPDVAELATRFGFDYIVRPNRGEMKKAGNMVHAFGLSDNEIVAIFDADFCPRRDYLYHLVPYFDDPDTGIVQSPQCFDTTAEMGWVQRCAGATQELFYRWVQPSRDSVDAAICVGTNALYRRSALDLIGGFALIEHSEDVHTGLALLREGFATRYVPVLLAKGLCPDDLGAFLNQQYRWANGSLTKVNYAGDGEEQMGFRQKISFWAGFMYYLTTAINVFAIYLPALIMAIAFPRDVRPSQYVPFLAGAWVYLVLMPAVSKTQWRFEVLRVQMAYSFSHAVAIFDKLRGREAAWVPTGAVKGGNLLTRRIGRVAIGWLTLSTIAPWAWLVVDVARFGPGNFWPMALFLVGYTYLAVPLIRELATMLIRERRSRQAAQAGAIPATPEAAPVPVVALLDTTSSEAAEHTTVEHTTVEHTLAAHVATVSRPRPTRVHVIVDASAPAPSPRTD